MGKKDAKTQPQCLEHTLTTVVLASSTMSSCEPPSNQGVVVISFAGPCWPPIHGVYHLPADLVTGDVFITNHAHAEHGGVAPCADLPVLVHGVERSACRGRNPRVDGKAIDEGVVTLGVNTIVASAGISVLTEGVDVVFHGVGPRPGRLRLGGEGGGYLLVDAIVSGVAIRLGAVMTEPLIAGRIPVRSARAMMSSVVVGDRCV